MFVRLKNKIDGIFMRTSIIITSGIFCFFLGCTTKRTIRVVDDCGLPIADAFVYLCEWDFIPWRYGFYGAGIYLTDTNGVVRTRKSWGARMMVGAHGYWIESANHARGKQLTVVLSPVTSPPPYNSLYSITKTLEVENAHLIPKWNAYKKEMIKQGCDYHPLGQWRTDDRNRITSEHGR